MGISQNFGVRLSTIREKRGISREDLAHQLGLTNPSQISRYESNKAFPTAATLQKIAVILRVDLHWLITGEISLAMKLLKPFAQNYLAGIMGQIQTLEKERSDLLIQFGSENMNILVLDDIKEKLENMRLLHKNISQNLNEFLGPMGESI